jgi:hypothetical protein
VPKKKAKPLTEKALRKLIDQTCLKNYTQSLSNQLNMLRGLVDNDSELGQFKTDTRVTLKGLIEENTFLRKHLLKLAEEVMVHDYIIGRTTRPQLIDALKEFHKHDMLSVTEHLENIDQEKDMVLKKLRTTKKEKAAFECYHANENPATCPCPKKCYCKDKTCLGKVSW